MLRIGIIGSENTHTLAMARTLNIQKAVPGVRVEAVWGETRALARAVAEKGQIPRIVREPKELIGLVDAAVVDHRDGKRHLPAARALLRARLPLFIDKPLCCSLAEGQRFLAEAARRRVPVTSFSVAPLQKSFAMIKSEIGKLGALQAFSTCGAADLFSKHSGIFFYGIHQVAAILDVLGPDVKHGQVNRSGRHGSCSLWYADGLVATMQLLPKKGPGLHVTAVGEKGVVTRKVTYDSNPYITGIRKFVRMFRTGKKPYDRRELLAPVAVLEALGKSLRSGGKKVKVAKF